MKRRQAIRNRKKKQKWPCQKITHAAGQDYGMVLSSATQNVDCRSPSRPFWVWRSNLQLVWVCNPFSSQFNIYPLWTRLPFFLIVKLSLVSYLRSISVEFHAEVAVERYCHLPAAICNLQSAICTLQQACGHCMYSGVDSSNIPT